MLYVRKVSTREHLQVFVHRDLKHVLNINLNASVNLGALEDGEKDRLLCNLQRGYCSAMSRTPFEIYKMLARNFNFPIIAIGTGSRMIITCREDNFQQMLGDVYNLWRMSGAEKSRGSYKLRNWRPYRLTSYGNWRPWEVNKPLGFKIEGLLNVYGVKSFTELAGVDKLLDAMQLVQTGGKLPLRPDQ